MTPPNRIVNGDGFYISYNSHDISIYGCDTTALVLGQMEAFFILNGDHRVGFSKIIDQGFDACMGYFRDNAKDINKRSEPAKERM